MTIQQAAEEIVLFCEQNHDYLTRINYVKNKFQEINETRVRDTECQSDNRQNGMSSVERENGCDVDSRRRGMRGYQPS